MSKDECGDLHMDTTNLNCEIELYAQYRVAILNSTAKT